MKMMTLNTQKFNRAVKEAKADECPIYIISLATYGHERIAQIVIVDKTQISIFHLHRRTSNRRIRRGGYS